MSAAVAAGTPAAPAPVAPLAPGGSSAEANTTGFSLSDVLGDLPAAAADATEPTTVDPDAEQTDETDPEEPTNRAEKLDDEVIFSDESLETKEGVLRAKGRVRALRKMTHEKYLELKKFDGRLKGKAERLKIDVDRHVEGKRNDQLMRNQVMSDLQALHSGDPELMIQALGRMTGRDGIAALEAMNHRLISRSKDPELDPRLQAALKKQEDEILSLKSLLTSRDENEKAQQLSHQINQHRGRIGEMITKAADLPHLARVYADDPQGVLDVVVEEIEKVNGKVDPAQLFRNMEAQLTKHLGAGRHASQEDGGAESATQNPAVSAQRSPGQSVGSSHTGASGSPRHPSNEEAQRQLANDASFWKSIGLNPG